MLSQEQLAVALKAFGEALPAGTKLHSMRIIPTVGCSDTHGKPVLAFVLAEADEDFHRFSQVVERGLESFQSEVGLASAMLRDRMGFTTSVVPELETALSGVPGCIGDQLTFNPLNAVRNILSHGSQ
ncbi:hypothetical protein K5D56_21490 [Pseudomonas cichorii]|nr:hypothetical protein [Pseudomonas cichorii]MBX8557039.1 hypothetical protein [Pseudomonas cichorii]MBX8591943.1 hypothetical protein [Pseudomonas cichorii]